MTVSTAQIAGFVLAGGKSSRMGRDKARLEIGGIPLVLRAARLVASVAVSATVIGNAKADELLGLRWVGDDWPGAGPLGAIATALRVASGPWSLIVACDLPYVTKEWLDYLTARAAESQGDAVVAVNAIGAEPLCAMYNKSSEKPLVSLLTAGVRKVHDGLKTLRVEAIEPAEWKRFDSEGLLFKNVNTPEDYEEACVRLRGVS